MHLPASPFNRRLRNRRKDASESSEGSVAESNLKRVLIRKEKYSVQYSTVQYSRADVDIRR
jgi:hypothetical protein